MLKLLAPLVYLCLATLGVVALSKKSFGKSLPLVLFGSALSLFFSQLLFGTFSIGFYLCLAFAVFSLIFAIYKIAKKDCNDLRKNFFTTGLIAFVVIYIAFSLYDFHRGFAAWDEFSHWGMMLKEMVRLDKFYYVDASNLLIHKDYPPALQLFELFWIKLSGGFSESAALSAVHIFEFSLLVPLVVEKVLKKKAVLKSVLLGVAVIASLIFLVLLFDLHGVFHTVYNDYSLALVTAYLLFVIFASKHFRVFEILELTLGGAFLLLLKQMGLPLYLMALAFLAGIVLVRYQFKIKKLFKSIGWKKLCLVAIALLLPFVLWFVWGRLTANVPKQFEFSDLSVTDLPGIITGSKGESWQRFTIKKFLVALGTENITTSIIPLSFAQVIVVSLGAFYLVYRKFHTSLDRKNTILLGLILLVGALGYSGAMLILYVFSFGSFEGPNLASYERYMGTFAIIMLAVVLLIFVREAIKAEQGLKLSAALACTLALVVAPSAYTRLYPNPTGTTKPDVEKAANFVMDNTESGSKVFVEYQNPIGFFYFIQYYLSDRLVNNTNYTWPTTEPKTADEDTPEAFLKKVLPELKNYDYLLVRDADEAFLSIYCSELSLCSSEPNTLYKITKTDDSVKLEKLTSLAD